MQEELKKNEDTNPEASETRALKKNINFQNKHVQLITRTAALLAVTLILQFSGHYLPIPAPGGAIFVGSLVNMCLFLAAISVGLIGGAVISFITPVVAFLSGHMGFPQLIFFIGVANYILVVCGFFILKGIKGNSSKNWWILVAAIVVAGVLKFMAMYFGVLQIAPLLGVPAKPIQTVMQINFSWPQLVSAIIGGVLAVPIAYGLKRARAI